MTGFAANAVFTDRTYDHHSQLQDHLLQQFSDMGSRLTDASLTGTRQEIDAARTEYRNTYGEDPVVDATRAGGMFRAIENGLQLSQDREIASEEQRQQNVELLIGFGAALIPGVGKYVGDLASDQVVKHLLTQGTGFAQSTLTSEAKSGLTSLLTQAGESNLDDKQLAAMRGSIAGTLPNDTFSDGNHSLKLLDAFDSGYNQTS